MLSSNHADRPIRFATRAEMRAYGREWGRDAGRIVAEATVAVPGELAPAEALARASATRTALAAVAERFRELGCRDRQLLAFRLAAERAVVEALDAAAITISAVGALN